MKLMKGRSLFLAAVMIGLALLVYLVPRASCAAYPEHNIQLIIPYVAGATGDITARLLAEELQKVLGVKIIPSNKPGAASVLGTDAAARAKKDGYTLLYSSASAMIYAPITNPDVVHYNPFKDLEPIGFHYFFPTTIGLKPDAAWKTFPELIDFAKKNPGKLRYSTVGVASTPHIVMQIIEDFTGAKFTHVPFEGGESVITAVLGGHVEFSCDGYAKMKPHADAGRLRIILTGKSLPQAPKVPMASELGYKETIPNTWYALYAPAGVPEEVRKALIPAMATAVKATKAKIEQMGSIPEYKTPAETRKLQEDEYKRAFDIAVKTGMRKP
jgi:tripartite-type tricarboxylate transporter receptor subunit TctC